MLKKIATVLCLFTLITHSSVASAQSTNHIIVTMVVASNSGNDFNLDNDAYRDKLLNLFSYSSYVQKDIKKLNLELGKTQNLDLLEDYNLELTVKKEEGGKILVRAVIIKNHKIYIDTELSIAKPGTFFMGGPTLDTGDLILILESGY